MFFYLELDPCFQPVGITNGLVTTTVHGETRKPGLDGSCEYIALVWARFETSMTIKGIAIKSTDRRNDVKRLPMDYAYNLANPWIRLYGSSRSNTEERVKVFLKFLA